MSDKKESLRYASILLAFTLSGCAGLIFQSIWAQYLGLFLGHAAYAQSVVLAIYMGGMAIGAQWVGLRSYRWQNLLRTYAVVELAIGIGAAVFHSVYLSTTQLAYEHVFPWLGGGALGAVFKWVLAALLILPQTVLLGATFPLLSNGLMRRMKVGDGNILSTLYFTNSIGAAVGALLATFVLLPAVGLPGAMRVGAILNVVVALLAFVVSTEREFVPETASPAAGDRRGVSGGQILLAAAFITGATSFVYEIGWVRMLSLVFGSTVHAFELMLAAFIGGLAFGGLAIRKRIDRYEEPVRVGGYVQVFMGLAALASLILYDRLFDWVAWFITALSKTPAGYDLYNVVTAVLALLIMAPAAFFAGMTLPVLTLALVRKGGGEASVGRIYAANTFGAIAGVFLAMHALIPGLGLKLGMTLAATGDLILGMFLLRRTIAGRGLRSYAVTGVVCAAAVAITVVAARFDPLAMASGVYRSGQARLPGQGVDVRFYRDGKTASVASVVLSDGRAVISTNGKPDASIRLDDSAPMGTGDEITMTLAAMLPLGIHADPKTAAVIGFGSGLTTHTLLGDPRLSSVDTIEIERAMYEGAKIFGSHVGRAYSDPRSHVYFDDAKAYFAANQSRYDIIISEPSNPWVSGVANLFSREFYSFVPRHLNRDGIFVQWVQEYEITDELIGTVVRALNGSFADFRIYLSYDNDMLIVAKANGALGDFNPAVLDNPALREQLKRTGLVTAADIAIHEVGDKNSLLPLYDALSRRTNSDFYPLLSLEAPKSRFARDQATTLRDLTIADVPLREVVAGLQPALATDVSINPNYSASMLTHQAADIAKSLESGSALGEDRDPSLAWMISFARMRTCRGTEDPGGTADGLIDIAGRTIPFLSASALQGVWTQPAWLACSPPTGPIGETLAVLDALSRRDFLQSEESAVRLLHDYRSALSPISQGWLLRVAMLSAIGAGDFDKVHSLDLEYGGTIAPYDHFAGLQREYLTAFARARMSRIVPPNTLNGMPGTGVRE